VHHLDSALVVRVVNDGDGWRARRPRL